MPTTQNALEQLPPQEREVFEMSRLENIKYQEIANRLNISVRTVEVRISKALKQLRILLKDFYLLLFSFFSTNGCGIFFLKRLLYIR